MVDGDENDRCMAMGLPATTSLSTADQMKTTEPARKVGQLDGMEVEIDNRLSPTRRLHFSESRVSHC